MKKVSEKINSLRELHSPENENSSTSPPENPALKALRVAEENDLDVNILAEKYAVVGSAKSIGSISVIVELVEGARDLLVRSVNALNKADIEYYFVEEIQNFLVDVFGQEAV